LSGLLEWVIVCLFLRWVMCGWVEGVDHFMQEPLTASRTHIVSDRIGMCALQM
jgi:hypothetical protein